MALVLGDVHGRYDKAKAFLEYKPEILHVFAGDYVDSFNQPDAIIYGTLKLVIESDAKLLLGNHDIHYLDGSPFRCSGYRQHTAKSLNQIFESFIERFVPAFVEDGFVIIHGGISNGLGNSLFKTTNVTNILDIINSEWDFFLKNRRHHYPQQSRIFYIPKSRGGSNGYGGIFWADYRDEEFYGVPQVFGHSKTSNGVTQVLSNHWALGCDDEKFECFNTATKEVEYFGPTIQDAA